MKIQTNIYNINKNYEIIKIINDIAIIQNNDKNITLYDLVNNKILLDFDKYVFNIYKDEGYIIFKKDNYCTIFDIFNKNIICEKYEVIQKINNGYRELVLKNENKYKLFKMNNMDIFNYDFDYINYLYDRFNNNYYIVKKDNNYSYLNSSINSSISFNFDNIENKDCVIVFTKDNQKKFIVNTSYDSIFESKYYNDIKIDQSFKNIIYAYINNILDIYIINNNKCQLLYRFNNYNLDEISCLYSFMNLYFEITTIFKTKKDNHYGVIGSKSINNKVIETVNINNDYDDINIDNSALYLYKDNKMGYYDLNTKMSINCKYDNIKVLNNSLIKATNGEEFIILHNGKVALKGDYLIEESDKYIKYNRKGRIHLFIYDNKKYHSFLQYEDVKIINDSLFIFKIGRQKLLYYKEKMLFPVDSFDKLKEINVKQIDNTLIVTYKKESDEEYSIIRIDIDSLSYTSFSELKFDKVEFINNLVVGRQENKMYIYNLDGKLLFKNDNNVSIKYYNTKDELSYYLIDEELYVLSNSNLYKVPKENIKLYATLVQTKKESVFINTYSKQENEDFIKSVDNKMLKKKIN